MQFAVVLDRPPVLVLGGDQDFGSSLDLGKIGAHRFDDGDDLVRVDAPHAQVAELVPRAAGIVPDVFDILQFGGHVVRRDATGGQRGGADLAFGAGDQRVLELAGAVHGAARNGAVVAGDEIHQAEIEALDAGQGGDLPDFAQGAVGLDQDVYRNPAVNTEMLLDFTQGFELDLDIADAAGLGQGDEGQATTGATDQDFHVLPPVRVGDIMDTGADAIEQVVVAHDDAGDHFGMFALGPGNGAILAVAGDVENRSELLLQLQRLLHQLFRPCVMVDHGQDGEGCLAGKKNGSGMAHEFARHKRKGPRYFTAALR